MNEVTVSPVSLTKRAVSHIQKQIAKNELNSIVRLSVKPTGCSGWSYVVELVDLPKAQDAVFRTEDGISVSVDNDSYPLVKGIQIDYVRTGINERFEFNNPNAKNVCGCGESFNA